jgi:hypothetical protein
VISSKKLVPMAHIVTVILYPQHVSDFRHEIGASDFKHETGANG